MTTLVVGGAGYIGAHVVDALLAGGKQVVVVDDLSTGVASRVPLPVVRIDISQPSAIPALSAFMADNGVTEVVHLAAKKDVGESVTRPMYYYSQNIGGTAVLLEAMQRCGVRSLVFSSSAAVYGDVEGSNVSEDTATVPVNPYGESKLACERLIHRAAEAWPLRAVALRYFNVAGAARPALADTGAANLVAKAVAASRAGRVVSVFGDDYPTPDGTCIRDYINVIDLADAHLAALEYLTSENAHVVETINVGTGLGASVLEMLDALQRTGSRIDVRIGPRRVGDPARVVADPSRASEVLGWTARRTLEETAASAWLTPIGTTARQVGPRGLDAQDGE